MEGPMTAQEPTPSVRRVPTGTGGPAPAGTSGPAPAGTGATTDGRVVAGPDREPTDRPVTRLRGATVDVDPRRAKQLVLVVCLVALAVVAVILLIAGVQKNDQADNLQQHGVEVNVTVDGCLGLLGGSGSNGAGFACKGTYTFDGRQYRQSIPGNAQRIPGSVIRGVIVADDPTLLSTPALVAESPSSSTVFIAPAILFAVLVLALVVLAVARHHRRRDPASDRPR